MSPCHLNLLSELASPVILKRLEQTERQKFEVLFKSKETKKASFLNL